MRIALVHNLPSGGAKRALFEWTRRLAGEHELQVFTLSTGDHDFCDLRPFVRHHRVFPFAARRLYDTPLGRLNQVQRWRDLAELDALGREIAAAIDAAGFDVVFAHTCQFTSLPACLPFLRTPAVYYLHEAFGRGRPADADGGVESRAALREWLDRADPLPGLYRARLDALHQRGLDAGVRLLANSAFTAERMRAAYGIDSPVVCRCGVDGAAFRPVGEGRGTHVLSVGELSRRKGFGFLIEALGLVPEAHRPTLRLACNVVQPDERRRVEGRARELGVRLEIAVGLSSEQLAREYSRAAICVYAPHYEPFGLVPLEAMACGTAVVGIDEGGVRESVLHGRTGVLVPRDARAFADAIRALLTDPRRAAEYGARGRAHALEAWTWERSTAAIEAQLLAAAAAVPAGVS